jgi:3-oxoacyl-[acyl-carrier protein] reductase
MSTVQLTGKVAVVTGGSRGIGAACSKRLASLGAQLAIVYRRDEKSARGLAEGIQSEGGRAEIFQADVSDPASVKALIPAVVKSFGRIDILVNNAAILETGPLGEIDPGHFQRVFATNVSSVVFMVQEAVPHFPKTGGHIVNFASSLVFGPIPTYAVYTASKAAVVSLTLSLSKELGPRGIRVNCVSPGLTLTDMTKDLPKDIFDHLKELTPLGRLGQPTDIAEVVAFLASPASGWITGRTLEAEGGIN